MRISDWSSDVCSSDLQFHPGIAALEHRARHQPPDPSETVDRYLHAHLSFSNLLVSRRSRDDNEIGPFLGVRLLGRSALHACNDLGGDLLLREAEILVEVARRRRRAEAVDPEAKPI